MKKTDIITLLPVLHNLDIGKYKEKKAKGLNKYQLIRILFDEGRSGNYYAKIEELIDMGFLEKVNDKPPEFIPDKVKIWEFFEETPIGDEILDMVRDHKPLFP